MSRLILGILALTAGSAFAAPVVVTANSTTLVNTILGPGVTLVGSPNFTGNALQGGTFTGGAADIGFASGIVLSSGNVTQIPGANIDNGGTETFGNGANILENLSTGFGGAGDSQLNTLAGGTTGDAAELTFSFEFAGGLGGDLFFNFAFASDEYIDFVNSGFNDVFGFFIDGVNIALTPPSAVTPNLPITIDNINPVVNPALYINNVANTNGYPDAGLGIKFDGITTVLTAQKLGLSAGVHTMKLAIADTADTLLDSGVFIQAGTFSNVSQPPVPGVPEPGYVGLVGSVFLAVVIYNRYGKRAARS